mgnify:CR=1 FL=1
MLDATSEINIHVDFKRIFDEYFSSLCVFAYKFVKDEDIAKDLTQDVFAKVWKSGRIFESEKAMRAYLYFATRNTALDYLRKEKRKGRITDISTCEIESDNIVVGEIIKEETFRLLDNTIELLPPKAREVIKLSLEGLSIREIAEKLDVSVNTIKTHKSYAFRKIREHWGTRDVLLSVVGGILFWGGSL